MIIPIFSTVESIEINENKMDRLKQNVFERNNGDEKMKLYISKEPARTENSMDKKGAGLVIGDEYARNISKTMDALPATHAYNIQGYVN